MESGSVLNSDIDGKECNWYPVGLGGTFLFETLHLMCVVDQVDKEKKQRSRE